MVKTLRPPHFEQRSRSPTSGSGMSSGNREASTLPHDTCRVGAEEILSTRDMPIHWWRNIKCPDYQR
jgi:hypothetical protein